MQYHCAVRIQSDFAVVVVLSPPPPTLRRIRATSLLLLLYPASSVFGFISTVQCFHMPDRIHTKEVHRARYSITHLTYVHLILSFYYFILTKYGFLFSPMSKVNNQG